MTMPLLPRRAWMGHGAIFLGAAAASYAATVAAAAVNRLSEGRPFDASILIASPIDPVAYWFVPTVAAIFVLEALYLGWRESPLRQMLLGRSLSHRSDVFYFACTVLMLTPMLVLVMSLGLSAALDAWLEAPRTWRLAADLPLWIAVPLCFVIESFVIYWLHRFMHTKLMWPLHATHHAAEEMTALTTVRHHPLDSFVGNLSTAVIVVLFAFPAEAVFVSSAIGAVLSTLVHSRLPFPGWVERYFLTGPRLHAIHHSADPDDYLSNLGLVPLFDRMFGTFRWHDKPLRFGVDDARLDTGRPLHDMFVTAAIWLDGLRHAIVGEKSPRTV